MWHYTKAEAAARRGDVAAIEEEEKAMTFSESDAALFGQAASNGKAMVAVARLVLQGRVAMLQGRFGDAVNVYAEASKLQDDELAGIADPPGFWYPVRRGMAAAYLAAGDLPSAEKQAKTVLARFPNEPLTRQILASVSSAEGNAQDAALQADLKQANWQGESGATPVALL